MLDKTFSAAEAEARLYAAWESAGAFQPKNDPKADPYCIVIPPPNVTGSLHMGHALNNTLQDILVRYERMRGKSVLWQPGMDHAGIATQMVVERQLAEEGTNMTRRDMGRDAFVERIWKWKEESGGTIFNQLRRLGASCDWSRERFTMDEGLSAAVLKVFVQLYREGLIYKDKRLVNWDPKLQTAISDLEVVSREVKGHLWHFKYPIEGEEGAFITVATTRPETMLGDTGVAVHPDDERYKHLVGKYVILPIVGRRIPIVADEYADPEQGSGAVKITPAHDFNDFEVGRRQSLEMINILDAEGHTNENAPEGWQGLERFKCRDLIVKKFEELGLLVQIDDHTHQVPFGDRSDVVIEPWLTDQWYVDAKTLAAPALKAVRYGDTVFVPKNWENTYFNWLDNIQPWCISRQLWWGHQIPAWYAEDGTVFVADSEEDAAAQAKAHFGKPVDLTRDEDVLDTWFSSALWPFSTLGWPDQTPELDRFYKTDVLVTGFDIIFFWVARMMMMGLHFMKEVPFHTVYIHALVRDEHGAKMSKSKGNIVDPLELIDEFGADALRFTLAAMAAQGRDIKLAKSRIEGYRNFGTKLWNAARFCEMNECVAAAGFEPGAVKETVNKWIVGETEKAIAGVEAALHDYKFNEAAGAAYRFVWNVYCDWYLEFIKAPLNGHDEAAKAETRATAAWTLQQILKLLHPFMPFVTEELWARTAGPSDDRSLLITTPWPVVKSALVDRAASDELDWVIALISNVRSVRSEMNVPAGAKIPLLIKGATVEINKRIDAHEELIKRLARLEWINTTEEVPPGCAQIVMGDQVVLLPLQGVIDFGQEAARLEKEIGKTKGEIKQINGKLGNEKFLANAPDHVVDEQKERKSAAEERLTKLNEALSRIAALG